LARLSPHALSLSLFLVQRRRPPSPTLFPYTTLFRSEAAHDLAQLQPWRERPHIGAQRDLAALEQLPVAREHDPPALRGEVADRLDRKSTRLNSSHVKISYAVFCLKKKNKHKYEQRSD